MLVEACFESDGTVVDEIDEVMEFLKKTWVILGINQMLHNFYFTWALLNHFAMSDQVDIVTFCSRESVTWVKDAKTTEAPDYCDILSSTLSSMMERSLNCEDSGGKIHQKNTAREGKKRLM